MVNTTKKKFDRYSHIIFHTQYIYFQSNTTLYH